MAVVPAGVDTLTIYHGTVGTSFVGAMVGRGVSVMVGVGERYQRGVRVGVWVIVGTGVGVSKTSNG